MWRRDEGPGPGEYSASGGMTDSEAFGLSDGPRHRDFDPKELDKLDHVEE